MRIVAAPMLSQVTPMVAAAAANVATLGIGAKLREVASESRPEAADVNRGLSDMRLDGETRSLVEARLRARSASASVADDELPLRRYGKLRRECTLARVDAIEVVLLSIPRWILQDGNQIESLDLICYYLRGRTVRVVSAGLDAPAPVFNTLKRSWKDDENIDIEFVPWSQLAELAAGRADVDDVLTLDLRRPKRDAPAERPAAGTPTAAQPCRVFVSYSHRDREYVDEASDKSLLAYLRGTLEREGFEFWWDRSLVAGDNWDETIRSEIDRARIALVLVSQPFLNSAYCLDTEVEAFLEGRRRSGLVIFPVIVSSCDWQSHGWLARTQFEPRDGRNVETDYAKRGDRDPLYLSILNELRTIRKRLDGS